MDTIDLPTVDRGDREAGDRLPVRPHVPEVGLAVVAGDVVAARPVGDGDAGITGPLGTAPEGAVGRPEPNVVAHPGAHEVELAGGVHAVAVRDERIDLAVRVPRGRVGQRARRGPRVRGDDRHRQRHQTPDCTPHPRSSAPRPPPAQARPGVYPDRHPDHSTFSTSVVGSRSALGSRAQCAAPVPSSSRSPSALLNRSGRSPSGRAG